MRKLLNLQNHFQNRTQVEPRATAPRLSRKNEDTTFSCVNYNHLKNWLQHQFYSERNNTKPNIRTREDLLGECLRYSLQDIDLSVTSSNRLYQTHITHSLGNGEGSGLFKPQQGLYLRIRYLSFFVDEVNDSLHLACRIWC